MHTGQDYQIETDVAIIGGGTAGTNAAMAAAEKGLDVLVVDKANINRSGAIAGGIDHFLAYLETGDEWDTRESYLGYVGKVARGAANLKIHEAVLCKELKAAIERIERIGVSLRKSGSTEFYRTQAMGQPGPYFINFNGKRLKPKMAKEVHKLGCRVLNRVQVTNLFLHDGELAGFTGYNMTQLLRAAGSICTPPGKSLLRGQCGPCSLLDPWCLLAWFWLPLGSSGPPSSPG